ncbi:MAG: hypothetical protein CK427_11505 [Leptospira sp.]|nr:MAG: hypothetical protein CK427_11505 [Leptospira sp.]
MTTFLTLVGVLGAAAFFIYMLAAYDNKAIDKSQAKRDKEESKFKSADPRKIYNKNWDPKVPRPRVCPACGTLLKKEEYLYASISEHVNSEGKRQAHIYGCKYCYLGEVNSTSMSNELKELDGL